MVADFNLFLSSNGWDRTRARAGYDALFVDELHLFTPIERQLLHRLIKHASEDDGRPKRPAIFMAYDLKQSPRGLLMHLGEEGSTLFSAESGLQNADLVKLDQVFRYTPEIAEFLADLDAAYPAVNVSEEWVGFTGETHLASGSVPELATYKDERALFRSIFDGAHGIARKVHGGGRRVAVLCPSEEVFDRYLKVAQGQYEGKFVPVISRELSTELQHAGKRFIFSMPEYVAGLQFETVFLIHVDQREAPPDASVDLRQRFVSAIYQGASRAEQFLYLSCCTAAGGPSDILDMALQRGSLKRVRAK